MTCTVCILNISCPDISATDDLRAAINDFLEQRSGCRVVGSGRSCMEPSHFDIEIAFDSEKRANLIVRELRARLSSRCDLDVDWI